VAIGVAGTVVLQLQPNRARPVKASLHVGSRRGRRGSHSEAPSGGSVTVCRTTVAGLVLWCHNIYKSITCMASC
jgi:hypothetical protein